MPREGEAQSIGRKTRGEDGWRRRGCGGTDGARAGGRGGPAEGPAGQGSGGRGRQVEGRGKGRDERRTGCGGKRGWLDGERLVQKVRTDEPNRNGRRSDERAGEQEGGARRAESARRSAAGASRAESAQGSGGELCGERARREDAEMRGKKAGGWARGALKQRQTGGQRRRKRRNATSDRHRMAAGPRRRSAEAERSGKGRVGKKQKKE